MNTTIPLSCSSSLTMKVANLNAPQWMATHVRMATRALRLAHGFEQARTELHRSFGLCCPLLNWFCAMGADWPALRQTYLLDAFCSVVLRELGDPLWNASGSQTGNGFSHSSGNSSGGPLAHSSSNPEDELLAVCPCAPLYLRFSSNVQLLQTAPEFITQWQSDPLPSMVLQPRSWEPQAVALGLLEGESIEGGDIPVMDSTPHLTRSQTSVYQLLKGFLRLQKNARAVAGIAPRKHPLIAGPSGVGKTFLVRLLAARHGLAFVDFNVSNWLVNGAYQKPHTEQLLADFVKRNERGIVFIDEVDKIHGVHDWTKHVQQEVFAVLDGRMNTFPSWNETLRRKFVQRFLIVGAGTWQHMQPARVKEIGFGAVRRGFGESASTGSEAKADAENESSLESAASGGGGGLSLMDLSAQNSIPEELLFRFNARVARIDPMTRDEMREQIERIYNELTLPLPAAREMNSMLDEAISSGRQHRWLEALLSRLLMEAPADQAQPVTGDCGAIQF